MFTLCKKYNLLDSLLVRYSWYITMSVDPEDNISVYVRLHANESLIMGVIKYVGIKEVEIIFVRDDDFAT